MPLWFALGCGGLGLSICGWLIIDVRHTIKRHRQIKESVRRSEWMTDQEKTDVLIFHAIKAQKR